MTLRTFSFPTPVTVGPGARKKIPEMLKKQRLRSPLIVTDRGLAELPFISELDQSLKDADLRSEVFSGLWGNPLKSQAEAGLAAYQSHQADSIVAVGGGAALDVAKVIAVMVNHPGDVFQYEDAPGAKEITGKIPFVLAMATTAGTGSEVGRAAVISDDQTHEKKIIFAPALMPAQVVLDPEVTLKLPPQITASTGMDALTHLIEAFLAIGEHPMCDGIALEGMGIISKNLHRAVQWAKTGKKTKEHVHVRENMLVAAMMGAVAFQKGLGVTHSCAHALSTLKDLHHGTANGVLLPYTMKFNQKDQGARFKRMAQAVGIRNPSGKAFIEWIQRLNRKLKIPTHLSELGVHRDDIPELVRLAMKDGCHLQNPRKVLKKDFELIFKKAIG